MEPSVLQTAEGAVKPPRWWIILIAAAGGVGSLGTVAVAGKGTYDITPFTVRLEAVPAPLGETVLQVSPLEELQLEGLDLEAQPLLRAEAGTHASPVVAKATIVGITTSGLLRADREVLRDPFSVARFIGDNGEDAVRSFAIKVGGLGLGGGAGAGLLLSFGRWRRVAGGALAGLLTVAVIGGLMQQTYDTEEFQKTCFVVEGRCVGGGVPVDLPGGDGPIPDLLPDP